jgi:hypothetical protein
VPMVQTLAALHPDPQSVLGHIARHRRDPGDGRRGLDRGAKARLRAGRQTINWRLPVPGVTRSCCASKGSGKSPNTSPPVRVRAHARETAPEIRALPAVLGKCGRCARKSANTSRPSTRAQHFPSVYTCARPRARRLWKSKAVAGRQGRALADRSADPIREKRRPAAPELWSPSRLASSARSRGADGADPCGPSPRSTKRPRPHRNPVDKQERRPARGSPHRLGLRQSGQLGFRDNAG